MTLYLVPTPIGNLSDMTIRAVQVLSEVDCIYAEDTRNSKILLNHYNIQTPLKSYHKFNEKSRCTEIISILNAGKNIAIISDAGTPGISDPSNIIVREVIDNNIKVCALPGATAFVPALVASGFNSSRFYMAGFLPIKNSERQNILKRLCKIDVPIIFYEAPHRLEKTLIELNKMFNDCFVSIGKEISKMYESYYRGALSDILQNVDKIVLKGEFVIVLQPVVKVSVSNDKIIELYKEKYVSEKLTKASKMISEELGVGRNEVYAIITKTVFM